MPIMTTLQHWDHGFQPVQVRGLFRQHHPVQRPEMGHQEPDHGARPGIRPGPHARLRHLFDAGDRPRQVHDRNRRHRRRIHHRRSVDSDPQPDRAVRQQVLGRSGIPVLDMAANLEDLGKIIAEKITPKVGEYGLSIPEFYIENISLPEEVEKAMDKRTSMGVVGRPEQIHAVQRRRGDGPAGWRDGRGGMGTGMGAGMGLPTWRRTGGPLGRGPAARRPSSRSPATAAAPTACGRPVALPKTARPGPLWRGRPAPSGDGRPLTRATMVWTKARTAGSRPPRPNWPALLDQPAPAPPQTLSY
jgi:hypothetical protein